MRRDKMCAWLLAVLLCPVATMAQNFTGDADFVEAAEAARVKSAIFWTGKALPRWAKPCPIKWDADSGHSLTKYKFVDGEVIDFRMELAGSRESTLTDVIPHEVDHAVRATIVRKEIPRWLDEGAASLFESAESRKRLRSSLLYGDLQSSVWDMMTLKEYPSGSDKLTAFYSGSASVVEWMVAQRGPAEVLKAMNAGLDSDSDWQVMVGHSKQELRGHYEEWFAAKYGQETPTAPSRPHVDVWIAGDFPCEACEQFMQFAYATKSGRRFDYIVRKISLEECQDRGLQVPMFSVGETQFEGEINQWSDVEAWGEAQLGLNDPAPPQSVSPPVEPLALGWPQPQRYQRRPPVPTIPRQQPQPTQPGLTVSNEAVEIFADALDPAPKPKEPDPDVDWSGAVLVVAVSDRIPAVAKAAEGPAKRALQRLTKGHAILRIISERTNPQQFAEYETVLGLTIDKLHVSVLIPETEHAMPVDFAIKQIEIRLHGVIENFAGDKLRDIPVEPILERLAAEEYQAVWDLSFTADESRGVAPTSPIGILMALIGLLAGPKIAGATESRLAGWAVGKVKKHVDEIKPSKEGAAE